MTKDAATAIPKRRFGHTGRDVTMFGQGTYRIEENGAELGVSGLRRGLDEGVSHIDTAEMYDDAELIVAEAIEGRRDEVFLVSKVMPKNATRAGVIAACETSLKRLRTDRLDCYLLHWKSEHPLAETVAGFEALVDAGKILSWGVSNFDVPDLEEALAIAGPGKIACNQVYYAHNERSMEHGVLQWCEAHDVAAVGYKPYGTGKFPGADTPAGRVLADIGARHGATPHQVVLAALAQQAIIVVKASRPENATANARAATIDLTAEDMARFNEAFPIGPARPLFTFF